MKISSKLTAGVSALALAAFAIPVAAQQSGIEEITVTARKVGERLIDVPVAITALTSETLGARGITGFNELNDFVPGLRYENSAANRNDRGFHTITMRGMYPGDSPNRQAVTAFVDGVPIPGGAIPGLTNIERVEVVNGPQSAYFGRSTFAGAINFITKAPSNEFHAMADVSYGSWNTFDGTGSLEGPIVADKLSLRGTVRYYNTDGAWTNFGYGGNLGARETLAGTFSLLAQPTDNLKVRGMFAIWRDSDGPSAQSVLNEQDYNCAAGGNGRAVGGRNYVCGGISQAFKGRMSQNIVPPVPFATLTNGISVLPDNFIKGLGLERREYQANLLVDYTAGDYTISANAGHNRNRWAALTDTYNRPPDGTGYYSTVYLPYDIDNTSAELRLASPQSERFKFLVGSNYYHESIFFQVRASRPPATTITALSQPTDYLADTVGIFGSASYDLVTALTLSVEARYQWDKIHHKILIANGPDAQTTFKSFSPRVILDYHMTDSSDVYASFARGTRPGTFNLGYQTLNAFQQQQVAAQFAVPLAVPEETLNTWELGVKGDFLDRRLRILSAAYYGTWRGRQINQNIAYLTAPGSTTTSTNTFTLANGKTDLWGLELQSTLKVSDKLTFEGTLNWAHTKILQTSCTECVAINGVLNPVGNSMERYPTWSGTFGVQYDQPINDKWTATARVDYIYVGRMFDTATNVAWTDPGNRVNARIGINNGQYTFELYGKNMFNNRVPSNILRNANPNANVAQGANLIVIAPPEAQTFGVRAVLRY